MKRRKSRTAPRCRDCHAVITWFRENGRWRTFDPRQVDRRTYTGAIAFPIYGGRAWRLVDLVPELMASRGVGQDEATQEAYDLPWHVPHTCPSTPTRESE